MLLMMMTRKKKNKNEALNLRVINYMFAIEGNGSCTKCLILVKGLIGFVIILSWGEIILSRFAEEEFHLQRTTRHLLKAMNNGLLKVNRAIA